MVYFFDLLKGLIMKDVSERLSIFLKLVNESLSIEKLYTEYLQTEDKKTQDILHKIELEHLTRDERAKICNKLAEVRRQRREYKDVLETIKPLCDFLEDEKNLSVIRRLEGVLGEIRKKEKSLENRVYIPRVLEDGDYLD